MKRAIFGVVHAQLANFMGTVLVGTQTVTYTVEASMLSIDNTLPGR